MDFVVFHDGSLLIKLKDKVAIILTWIRVLFVCLG